jgi:hypothetical protein
LKKEEVTLFDVAAIEKRFYIKPVLLQTGKSLTSISSEHD